jgi:type I restriction enzyme S subunit
VSDELREGWAVVTLPHICAINPPKPLGDALSPDAPVTFVPMPAVDAEQGVITNPILRAFSEMQKGFTGFRDKDVIMAKITPCMENGKAAMALGLSNALGLGSTEFHVLRSAGAVLPRVCLLLREDPVSDTMKTGLA